MTISDTAAYLRVMRLACVLALTLLIAGAAAAASPRPSPISLGGMVESHGAPDLGSAPGRRGGELLRFLPRAQFQLGLLLQNRSKTPLEITAARVVAPPRSLIHQIGTHFHRWHVFKCPPGAFCPAHVFPLKGGAGRPRPFALAARRYVGVELDFALGSCKDIPGANPAALSRLRVTFRRPDGTTGRRVFSLGATSIILRMPKPADCKDPRSTLSIDGPQRYESSNYWTVPGSTGDVCTIRNGMLNFVSRKYQTEISRAYSDLHYEEVTFHLDRFKGPGAYGDGTVKLIAAKRTVWRSHTPVVQVTKATKREVIATIEAGRLPSGTTRGIPFHITGTMRCSVR